MDCNRYVVFIASVALAIHASLNSYNPSQEEQKTRSDLLASINEPGLLSQGLSYLGSTISAWIPNLAKSCVDNGSALMVSGASQSTKARSGLKQLFFGKDNKTFAQYDGIVGVHSTIPETPVQTGSITKLIEAAQSEREAWANGFMSGGNYDGSLQHMQDLADFYRSAIENDDLNKPIFSNDKEAQHIAVEAFKHFQTANPLHGTSFPLAVKAMRELGFMLADLVHKKHAIVSSGGQESIRLGIRALKIGLPCSYENGCTILAIDDEDRIAWANQTLRIGTLHTTADSVDKFVQHADAVVLYLTQKNIVNLNNIIKVAHQNTWPLHIHFAPDITRELIVKGSDSPLSTIFSLSSYIRSLSFDTEGLLYSGISATIFADDQKRFDAIETYIDWSGGIYPAINSAGSISGVDYIIAYLLTLHKGLPGIKRLSNIELLPLTKQAKPQKINYSGFDPVTAFSQGISKEAIEQTMKTIQSMSPELTRREILHQMLVDVSLSIFNAPKNNYAGIITSGGTESIRLAVQAYSDRLTPQYPGIKPIFLMSDTAHIAFDRQINDLGATIVRVKNNANKNMDTEDLKAKIKEYGAHNISAIVISLPNYPFGAADQVRLISSIAAIHNIPAHVDSCLGAWVLQFIDKNPLAINLTDKEFAGITSVSADIHKYGISQKGLSFLAYKKSIFTNPPQQICQIRSSSHLEVGLAGMLHIGKSGYQRRAASIVKLAGEFRNELEKMPTIELVGKPEFNRIPHFVIAWHLKDKLKTHTYTLASFMKKLGWHVSQVSDYTLHMAVTNAHVHNEQFLPKFISDLTFAINALTLYPNLSPSSSVGVYGMAANTNGVSGHYTQKAFLTLLAKLYAENLMSVAP
jgi:sphinganine-1-phosphate aldolase